MKNKILWLGFVLMFVVTVYAGINIPAGNQTQVTIGGVTQELDDKAACVTMHWDFQNQTVLLGFREGSISGPTFTPGNLGKFKQITLSFAADGSIFDDGGTKIGTLSAGQLTALQTLSRNQRNSAESFVVNNNLIQGTQVAW